MIEVKVVNLQEIKDYITAIPDDAFQVMKTEIARSLLVADEAIKNNTDLKTRSGSLFKSIRTQVSGNNIASFKASIYTNSVYAPTHQFGAVISAKDKYLKVPGGPYLNIPMAANKTASGVTRLKAREVFNRGGYIAKLNSNKYGVFLGSQLMFVLQRRVTVPKRLNMIEESEKVVPTMLSNIASKIGENR